DVLVRRVGLDEPVDRRVGLFRLVHLVLRVGLVELRLFGVRTERKARDKALEYLDRPTIVAVLVVGLALFVQLVDRIRFEGSGLVLAEERTTRGQRHGDQDCNDTGNDPELTGNSHAEGGSAMMVGGDHTADAMDAGNPQRPDPLPRPTPMT